MKASSRGQHADPPLLMSHSTASTSCDSRLEQHATAAVTTRATHPLFRARTGFKCVEALVEDPTHPQML